MALKKSIILPSSVGAEYHRIGGMFVHDGERLLEIHVQHYVNEDTRRETEEQPGGVVQPRWQPLGTTPLRVTGPEFTALFGPGVPDYPDKPALYAFLRTLPQFAGAVDV